MRDVWMLRRLQKQRSCRAVRTSRIDPRRKAALCRVAAIALLIPLAFGACARAKARPEPAPIRESDRSRAPSNADSVSLGEDGVSSTLVAKHLMVPVDGVTPDKVPDTYYATRTAGPHYALDILAPRGTSVLSADAGRVFKLRTNTNGGLTVYALDREEQFVYYYAHLDHYREGLAEGDTLEAGDVIGYVGTTGNAPPNVPHLHFQVMRYRRDGRWWDGEPINPHAYLSRRGTRRNHEGK